ncbi:hemolysin C [Treponema primitia ZAS-2]|uniref:Hemolysin C n=1 Tax=Treponema primitia (strain ATCC BAA-887 / DSM 12427 / ZAS-2) TaxID=545694 RepID=F5YMX8_TREPZ|nr:hemolysin family protein [Treponema primitia]AEF86030.1 hemolysin C [Treponema primitia ZAS-2]
MKLFFKKGEIDKKTYQSLETDQQEMIRGVVELSDTTVKEIMVPRIDTVFVSVDASREELLERVTEGGHSRFPVYKETIDNVVGILYVKDVLKTLVRNEDLSVQNLLRKPFFVPESKHINDLLTELRRRRVHIAVVVDEYGGVSGIICMENIIEEIIGDIQDEFDNETEDILKLGEGTWLCDARVNMEDLCEETGMNLPADDFDTLGGFVFDLFGKIPVKYEKAVYGDSDFIIQDMEGHKINTVKIVVKQESSKSTAQGSSGHESGR